MIPTVILLVDVLESSIRELGAHSATKDRLGHFLSQLGSVLGNVLCLGPMIIAVDCVDVSAPAVNALNRNG
jgi:hypothetical protein